MMTVGDVMTTSVVTVKDSAPLKDVAEVLIERGFSGMPVVDASGRVVGVVSEGDLLFKEAGREGLPSHRLGRVFGDQKAMEARRQKVEATTAGEAMTTPVITIRPTQTLAEAARLMSGQLVNRLVVMDGEKLVGIVTRADLVRAFVRTDQELADTIRGQRAETEMRSRRPAQPTNDGLWSRPPSRCRKTPARRHWPEWPARCPIRRLIPEVCRRFLRDGFQNSELCGWQYFEWTH